MNESRTTSPFGGPPGPPKGLNPWLKLALGFALILFFIFGVGSLSKLIPGARRMGEVIEHYDIRATAVWYTDFEASAEGSERIRDSLDYPPRGD